MHVGAGVDEGLSARLPPAEVCETEVKAVARDTNPVVIIMLRLLLLCLQWSLWKLLWYLSWRLEVTGGTCWWKWGKYIDGLWRSTLGRVTSTASASGIAANQASPFRPRPKSARRREAVRKATGFVYVEASRHRRVA